MLALRTHRHGHGQQGGGGGGGGKGAKENALFDWGRTKSGRIGGFAGSGSFPYPQGIPGLTKIVQFSQSQGSLIALDDSNDVYTLGNGPCLGIGTSNRAGEDAEHGEEFGNSEMPVRVTGGLPLYKKEIYGSWTQPEGPIGPVLPTIAAVAGGGLHAGALGLNGIAYLWGINRGGQLGNGFEFAEHIARNEEEGQRPQWAPFPVLIGPGPTGPQSIAIGETNVLKGITAMALAHEVSIFIAGGRIYIAGNPQGSAESLLYATLDPAAESITNAVAIAPGRHAYTVLLADGTERYVGVNTEGASGVGTEESKTNERIMVQPVLASGEPLKGITAIAKGEYFAMSKLGNGDVYVRGSNKELQLGLGLASTENVLHPTKITTLSNVIAIAAGKEERGTGVEGIDCGMALLEDHTIRVWGKNWFYNGVSPTWTPGCVLGLGTSESSPTPTQPLVSGHVTQINTTAEIMTVLVEPASAGAQNPLPSNPTTSVLRLDWADIPGAWRQAEGFKIIAENVATGEKFNSNVVGTPHPLISTSRRWECIVPAGEYSIKLISEFQVAEPAITGGAIKTATAKSLPIAWANPAKEEQGFVGNWRRTELYWSSGGPQATLTSALSTGASLSSLPLTGMTGSFAVNSQIIVEEGAHKQVWTVTAKASAGAPSVAVEPQKPSFAFAKGAIVALGQQEPWNRTDTAFAGSARSGTLALTEREPKGGHTPEVLTGEEVEVAVSGLAENPFGTRSVTRTVV